MSINANKNTTFSKTEVTYGSGVIQMNKEGVSFSPDLQSSCCLSFFDAGSLSLSRSWLSAVCERVADLRPIVFLPVHLQAELGWEPEELHC